jgi:cephalosporin hydroxylase
LNRVVNWRARDMTMIRTALLVSLALLTIGCRGKRPREKAGEPAQPARPVTRIDIGSPSEPKRLLRGFITASARDLRWTQRAFAVALDRPQPLGSPTYFEMDFSIPQETMTQSGEAAVMAVTVRANGLEVCRKTYAEDGRKLLSCPVPEKALAREPVSIEVESSKGFRDAGTGVERSLIIVSVELKEYEATADFEKLQSQRPRSAMDKVAALWKPVPRTTIGEMTGLVFRSDVYMNTRFLNVPIAKVPVDLWMMQQIIYDTKPEFLVETGTFKGGSAIYLAWLLQSMGLPGRVLTVDIVNSHRAAETNPLWKNYVDFYLGSSTDPNVVKKIAERVKGHRVLVTLDSDHSMLHVLRELTMYAPLVQRGGYLIAEDTHLDGVPTFEDLRTGPMAAVERFLDLNTDFERDYSREVAPSFNHGAWLRRK